jgi:hypothetical protein
MTKLFVFRTCNWPDLQRLIAWLMPFIILRCNSELHLSDKKWQDFRFSYQAFWKMLQLKLHLLLMCYCVQLCFTAMFLVALLHYIGTLCHFRTGLTDNNTAM